MGAEAVEVNAVRLNGEDLIKVDYARDAYRLAVQENTSVKAPLGLGIDLYARQLEVAALDDRT